MRYITQAENGDYIDLYITLYTMSSNTFTTYAQVYSKLKGILHGAYRPYSLVYHSGVDGVEVVRNLTLIFTDTLAYAYEDDTLATGARLTLKAEAISQVQDDVVTMTTFDGQ